jgi:hypothetical protein
MPAPFVLSSDLVSAYPAKSVTLADYIDTSLAAKAALASPALTGTPTAPTATLATNTTQIATTAFVLANVPASALAMVTATSFSASSAVNLNNVFTSANALYLVSGSVTMSGTDRPKFRMRVGGVDASGGSDYTFGWLDGSGSTATAATGSTSFWMPFGGTSNGIMTFTFQLLNPATAVFTQLLNSAGFDPTPRIRTGSARHGVSTAYDGFSITPETGGTMTGAVFVYKLQTT